MALLLLYPYAAPVEGKVLLVEDGVPRSVLVLSDSPHELEALAAKEIQEHLERMSQARLETVSGALENGMLPVRIGPELCRRAAQELSKKSRDPGAFAVSVSGDSVCLVGNNPEGTLFAAYELLEGLGCRWYLPGELGRVIPQRTTVSVSTGRIMEEPSFPARHLQNVSEDLPWAKRARLGGPYFPSSHGIALLPEADFEVEPDLFAWVDGKRQDSQLCLSHPEVLKRAVAAALAKFDEDPKLPWIGMGPRDTGGYCECKDCLQLDSGEIDPVTGRALRTDRYVWFFNQVLQAVHKQYPGKKIAFYAYDRLKFPPRKVKPSRYLVPAFAPITQCRIHGINNPVCPDREMYKRTILEWTQAVPETYERGYYFNLACPGFPFSKIHAVREETPFAHRCGVKGWRVETKASWISNGLTLYVASRLMWDVNTDVDALLTEFYEGFFGPAATPMGAYLEMVDRAFRDTDVHVGASFCMPKVFPPKRMAQAGKLLEEASRKASGDGTFPYAQRVRLFRLNHDRLDAFLAMLYRRNKFDFAEANERLDDLYEITDELVNTRLYPSEQAPDRVRTIPYRVWSSQAWAIYPSVAPSYIDRFWAQTTRSGFERTATRGDFVAGAPDAWDFLVDTSDVGEALGWYREGKMGGNWQKLRTQGATWSEQGLHYYKGVAWYRTEVPIPKRFEGREIFLWFGGVDEIAKVWLNGVPLGRSDGEGDRLVEPAGTFKPFEFHVTDLVRFEPANTIAVKIINRRLNEIGTGGITAPVMFWSPRPAHED